MTAVTRHLPHPKGPTVATTERLPLDLDAIRERYQKFDEVFVNADDAPAESLDAAMNTAEDVPALIAEVERLRAVNETLLNQLGDAADKLLALGWDDVAAQMEAGTYRPANRA